MSLVRHIDTIAILCAMTLASVCAHSCKNGSGNVEVAELKCETVCELDQSEHLLGQLDGFCVVNDTSFLLSTSNEVLMFGMDGHFIRQIGRSGRAAGEYNMPLNIASDEKRIYVFSAMDLKFVAYDKEGNFIDEYPYESAIGDFIASGQKLFIYPMGFRGDYLVDVYDLQTKSVVCSLTESSDSHKIFHWESAAPICIGDGRLYYMPRTELEINAWDTTSKEIRKVCEFDSESFIAPDGEEAADAAGKQEKWMKIADETSFIVAMASIGDGKFLTLTSEGRYKPLENHALDNDGRFYSLYEVTSGGDAKRLCVFPASTIALHSLISFTNGNLYFIAHSTERDNDVYTLNVFRP